MDEGGVRRKLAAILVADAAHFSRLMADDEAATVQALNASRALFRERIQAHGGHLVDTAGDSVLSEFPSAVDAVACAVEIQQALAERNARLPDHRRMPFRIGVNIGDVIVQDDGTLYGDGVNVAARIQALAEPGGIALSEDTHRLVAGKLHVDFTYAGEHAVKNIARPVRIWRALVAGQAAPATSPPPGMPFKPSIAVLPFDNMSGDPEQEFFADGLAEDLITALSRIHWLFVSARNSSFTFKGAAVSIREVARVLGVRYVVEGSVRKAGNRIRVTAQLIDAETGNHVWATRFDREIADIFAIQDEISEALAASIEPEIGQVERERARRKAPENLDCWEHYQRGLWHLYKFSAAENAEARRLLQRAIELDPEFGPAHTGLGYAHFLDAIMGFGGDSHQCIQDAYRVTRHALVLDDRDALAHYTLGRLYMLLGDPEQSRIQSQRAVELNPSLAVAHFGLGHALMLLGQAEQGVAEFDAAIRLSPRDPVLWAFECTKAHALVMLGRYEEAVEWARRSTRHPTAGVWASIALANALGHAGDRDQARAALADLLKMKPDVTLAFIKSHLPFNRESDFEHYAAGLIKAGLEPGGA